MHSVLGRVDAVAKINKGYNHGPHSPQKLFLLHFGQVCVVQVPLVLIDIDFNVLLAQAQIEFGAFTNQIEYQNAGAGINNVMKAEVLEGLDRDSLTGKTVEVTGVFKMMSPKMWLVTPVEFTVK